MTAPGHVCRPTVRHDLGQLDWHVSGWRPYEWLPAVAEVGVRPAPDSPPIPMRVPGSVQAALTAAGLLADWRVADRTRQCEWVEHRHWLVEADLPAAWSDPAEPAHVECRGLDHTGSMLLDRRPIGEFADSFVPHRFDLPPRTEGEAARIGFAFTEQPRYLGQVYRSSWITDRKTRFGYGWDWTPRLVQAGISDTAQLVVGSHRLDEVTCASDYDRASGVGTISVAGSAAGCDDTSVEVVVSGAHPDQVVARVPAHDEFAVTVEIEGVLPWSVNGTGEQPLYDVTVRLLAADGTPLDETARQVGFRTITWAACEGAPDSALPWICEVNGEAVFLQGFNWVPVRALYADVSEDEYRDRLLAYRDLGTNVLRAWGGAAPERELFYRLCDELGILVWQDLPLSSSGVDNIPPDDPDSVAAWSAVCASVVAARRHHPSLLLWCGGNELQFVDDSGASRPLGTEHPMLAALADTVAAADPGRRFLPTSPTGPRFGASADEFGTGVHHEVHGPWWAPADPREWADYWERDDALFRSEVGVPGSASVDLVRRFGAEFAWPGDDSNPYWVHTCAWWQSLEWPVWTELSADGPGSLEDFVAWSQRRQADALAVAVGACKARFPRCGGAIVWMGHDCHPVPLNTSVFDFDGRAKPAAAALEKVFRAQALPDRSSTA